MLERRLSARESRAAPPQVAKIGAWKGASFASFLRFWAVAANRNSSLAPLGPRRRNRSSLRMRFRCAKSISTFFRPYVAATTELDMGVMGGEYVPVLFRMASRRWRNIFFFPRQHAR